MSDFLQIAVDDQEVQKVLSRLARKVTDRRPVMRMLAGVMHRAVEDNFEAEGRPTKWPSLAPSTIRSRQRKGHWPGAILQVKGELARSITQQYDNDSAVVGTNKEYAKIHQEGGTIKRGARTQNVHFRKAGAGARFSKGLGAHYGMKVSIGAHTIKIKPRPFLVLTDGDTQEIVATALRYLKGAIE